MAVLSAALLLSTTLAGCSDKLGDLGNKNIRQNKIRYDANGNQIHTGPSMKEQTYGINQVDGQAGRVNGNKSRMNNVKGSHKNYRIEMSGKISEHISKLDAVKRSYVILADQNAYVAVSLAEGELQGDQHMMSRSNTEYLGKDHSNWSKRMSSLSTGEDKLTDKMKDKIAEEVKRLKPSVEHVYVSANPEFVGRMNAYMNDVKLGHPIQGYIAEFNALAERIFPPKSN